MHGTRRVPEGAIVRRLLVVLVAAAFMVGAAGCGSGKSSSAGSTNAGTQSAGTPTTTTPPDKVRFAKTKFLLHAGLAFGAFHRYIYKPWKNGTFTAVHGIKKVTTLTKAGLAALFAYHELKLAMVDARSSPLLSKLLSPLTAAADKLRAIGTSLRAGKLDPAQITAADGGVSALSRVAAQNGVPIKDLTPPANLNPTG
jgi:hypothetical protein